MSCFFSRVLTFRIYGTSGHLGVVLAETGTFDQLLARKGIFYSLYQITR